MNLIVSKRDGGTSGPSSSTGLDLFKSNLPGTSKTASVNMKFHFNSRPPPFGSAYYTQTNSVSFDYISWVP